MRPFVFPRICFLILAALYNRKRRATPVFAGGVLPILFFQLSFLSHPHSWRIWRSRNFSSERDMPFGALARWGAGDLEDCHQTSQTDAVNRKNGLSSFYRVAPYQNGPFRGKEPFLAWAHLFGANSCQTTGLQKDRAGIQRSALCNLTYIVQQYLVLKNPLISKLSSFFLTFTHSCNILRMKTAQIIRVRVCHTFIILL